MHKNFAILVSITLILLCVSLPVVANAAPPAQEAGQEYIVQAGDSLNQIAGQFYGDPTAYPAIVEATNEKAAEDSSFAVISDPNVIEAGQKLWIPAAGEPVAVTSPEDEAALQQAYLAAVKDAEIAEPDEISRDLTAIVESGEALRWQGEAGDRQVLTVTWTSWEWYDNQVGQVITTTRQTWVTVAPELQDFCAAYDAAQNDLTLRLEQLLGLPPNNGKTRFVEIWTSPADLFRPSPDPAITDHEAELSFPASKYDTVSQDYVAWFDDLSGKSYGENGYPWTRLGYTYDWGNPTSEIGLSEFVIDAGARVEIESVAVTEDYCR